MKKISPAQKKIILIAVIMTVAFFISWRLIYLPARNTIERLKSELGSVENQIQKIEAVIGESKTIDEGLALLEERYQRVDSKFIQQEEDSLRMLYDFAKKLRVEIVSITPEKKSLFLDAGGQKIEIEGKTCQALRISMQMKCGYKDLLNYLRDLREDLPGFIVAETIKISKDYAEISRLNIGLEFNLYLLS